MISHWQSLSTVRNNILIPKYYDPTIKQDLENKSSTHELVSIEDMIAGGEISLATGDEIGKLAYGTGSIPFVRTSDISNWEVKTAPKQGVSEEIFQEYAHAQDVKVGDILLVRDGTYLIGSNCFVTDIDKTFLYQSHILKIRINENCRVTPEVFFVLMNAPLVQRQIRAVQFTADIIDTIGNRFREVVVPIPKSEDVRQLVTQECANFLKTRAKGKAFIKQAPFLIEKVLSTASLSVCEEFYSLTESEISETLVQDTVSTEFGGFETVWLKKSALQRNILLPKYYDPAIKDELVGLSKNCDIISIGELAENGVLDLGTGSEPGKLAYGTGDIPFIRTSDFANWELKHDPKQSVSQEIYDHYQREQNLQDGDILLVRDGTYLVGNSTIVTESDAKALYCGGLYRIRCLRPDDVGPYLLLALLNSYVVKRQIRAKQFTRDVIDTIGKRFLEVYIPIPKDKEIKDRLSNYVKSVTEARIGARIGIKELAMAI